MSINITVFYVVICVCICKSHMFFIEKDLGYKWIECEGKCNVDYANRTIKVSNDIDGSEIVVGCAVFNNQSLPAKVKPTQGVAYVSLSGVEYDLTKFHILVTNLEGDYKWVDKKPTGPEKAVECGKRDHQLLFVGLYTNPNNVTYIGKIPDKGGMIYVPFNKTEYEYKEYKFLVIPKN